MRTRNSWYCTTDAFAFCFSAILCHHFHRPALRTSRRIVVLQYFYLAFSGLFSCLFSFSDPAYRISKCFLLSDLFSAYETCFRFPASVEVSRRFLRPPFNGIPVLPRLALLRPTFSAYVVLYEAFLTALIFFGVFSGGRKALSLSSLC